MWAKEYSLKLAAAFVQTRDHLEVDAVQGRHVV
jgi:hypothetical protein